LNAPGSVPAYSGVQKTTASARAIAPRSATTAAGSGSWSSSGLNAGSAARSSCSAASTPVGSSSSAARSAAPFVEPRRVLPETRRSRTGAGVGSVGCRWTSSGGGRPQL